MDRHGEINSANCVAVGRKESNAGLRSKKLAAIIIYSTLFPPRSFSVYSRFFVSFHPASTLEAWCSVASTVVVACNPILGVLLLGLPRCAPAYWDVVTLAHPLSLSLSAPIIPLGPRGDERRGWNDITPRRQLAKRRNRKGETWWGFVARQPIRQPRWKVILPPSGRVSGWTRYGVSYWLG